MKQITIILGLALLSVTATVVTVSPLNAETAPAAATPQPVDDSMHHLMEYVFEPSYKRLKASLAAAPATKADWKNVKGDALTLAEACNLLLHRLPEENQAEWLKLSVDSRTAGAALYQAARASDFAAASEAFRVTLKNCNACHDKFADGEHQLTP